MTSPRLALFVLEALPNARAVRCFVEDHAAEIAFVGLSNAERPDAGGFFGQLKRHLKRSGPAILPYLAINFALPDALMALHPAMNALKRGAPGPAAGVPLKSLCRQYGIPVLRVDDVNGAAVATAFRTYTPDLIVAFHFDQIFSAATLSLAPAGGLNVHPALLPRHRGPVPTLHALAEAEPAFGVTVHQLVAQIDAGAILEQESVALPPGTSASGAAIALHEHGRVLLDRVLLAMKTGPMPQGRLVATLPYCPFPDRALLRRLRRDGRRLVTLRDLRDAFSVNGRQR